MAAKREGASSIEVSRGVGWTRPACAVVMNLLDKLLVLHLVVIGCLIISSSCFPKFLGVLFVFASCGYLIDSFGTVLLPQFEAFYTAVVPATVPAELAFAFWLLIKGVNSDEQQQVLSPA